MNLNSESNLKEWSSFFTSSDNNSDDVAREANIIFKNLSIQILNIAKAVPKSLDDLGKYTDSTDFKQLLEKRVYLPKSLVPWSKSVLSQSLNYIKNVLRDRSKLGEIYLVLTNHEVIALIC